MNKLILIIAMTIAVNSFATPVILGDQTQILNFIAEVNTDPALTEYASFVIRETLQKIDNKKLLDEYEYAEFQYFSGNQSAALKQTDFIITKYSNHILTEESAVTLTKTFLLRATLSPTHQHKLFWVKKAYLNTPDFKPQSETFLSQISSLWAFIKNNTKMQQINISNELRQFHFLIVNNKIFDLFKTNVIQWPAGKVNFFLTSNSFLPERGEIHITDLSMFKPKMKPLVVGDCQNYHLNDQINQKLALKVFFTNNCIVDNGAKTTIPLVELDPVKPNELPNQFTIRTKNKTHAILKNNWIWIVLGGIAIYQYSNQKKSPLHIEETNTEINLPSMN